jgi:hypothetical protein
MNQPLDVPQEGASAGAASPADPNAVIVRAAIHPAIGVARVGNSTECFVGPEVVHPEPRDADFYRDTSGALKRQAARFRIFGYDAAGQVVRELTPDDAQIRWTVHVANSKAAWYRWIQAMDIPESATLQVERRNRNVTGDARAHLVIDGGARSIEGKGTQGTGYEFHGAFQQQDVYLGELRTDEQGRLLFLGGMGTSASPHGTPIYDENDKFTFINADGWYDDTSDGPVTATVSLGGRDLPVDPAWVVTAPPNYAPDVVAIRTLHDLLVDLYVGTGWMERPSNPSFTHEVYPILRRMSGLQWVNQGFATQFGHGGPFDFENPDFVARLARAPKEDADPWRELRLQVFNEFRLPVPLNDDPVPWPWEYGDADSLPDFPHSPRKNLAISATQHYTLQLWAAGRFTADWPADGQPPRALDGMQPAEQAAMLDRAALHFCLADAFHPGTEVTWPIRHISLFTTPFRIRQRPPGTPETDYGATLSQAQVLAPDGPLWAQGPGDLTRWMGLPWQADTAWCRSGYDTTYDPYLPTFWPARVPNQVLSEADYRIVVNPDSKPEEREEAFNRRADWNRLVGNDGVEAMLNMVNHFASQGVILARPGLPDDPLYPGTMMVENAILPPHAPQAPKLKLMGAADGAPAPLPTGGSPRAGFRSRADFIQALVTGQGTGSQ